MAEQLEIKITIKPHGSKFYFFVKRVFDILFSALFLILFGWLILLLLLIKFLEDFHRPVYVSKRVGKNGKITKFHKIRSMKPGAELMKVDLINDEQNEADGPVFKMKDDPRVTKFGKLLRKTSLDELLQFWDVLVGRLSIVGPRPPLVEEVKEYTEHQNNRLAVKGGLVCFWQISKNRHQMRFRDWVELDIKYIEQMSIKTDLKILFKAIWFVLTDRTGE